MRKLALAALLASAVSACRQQHRIAGSVTSAESDAPVANAPVFLDDGAEVRRTSTDAKGIFGFDIEPARLREARLLVCPPGMLALVNDRVDANPLGVSFALPSRPESSRKLDARQFGWRATVPDECSRTVLRR